MANGGYGGPSTARANNGGPSAAPATPQAEAVQSKRDLASWWKGFKRGNPKGQEEKDIESQGIFGVPLGQSIRYANVAISLVNEQGQSYIYGYVPIVVAKCGVYLKEKATDVEGIFRLSGAEKRIKDLKQIFDSPDRYGKGLDWSGYTVHDAANILRRYFNQLPEPIIPLDFYERFRAPLRNHQASAVGPMDAQGPDIGHFDTDAAIRTYQMLITELPPLNRQLLLYILDLLAVFASKSDLNKMTTPNLAAIFQPGLLSHPTHDLSPPAYRLSQDVLIFLIENQDSFLIGMQGTEADEATVQDVQSGANSPLKAPTTPTIPARSKTVISRSGSTASAGADSVRRFGGVRRNVSVSSRHSKQSVGAPSPVTPSYGTPHASSNTGIGVHRSNTVPSKKSPAVAGRRFNQSKTSDPPTPTSGVPQSAQIATVLQSPGRDATISLPPPASSSKMPEPPEAMTPSESEDTTPLAAPVGSTSSAILIPPGAEQTQRKPSYQMSPPSSGPNSFADANALKTPPIASANAPRAFFDSLLKISPRSEVDKKDGRRPNKLQKKRIPGSAMSSAQSSNQSLHGGDATTESPAFQVAPVAAFLPGSDSRPLESPQEPSQYTTAESTPQSATPAASSPLRTSGTNLKNLSPTASFNSHSSVADLSEADHHDESATQSDKAEKKRRWRFSSSQRHDKDLQATNLSTSNFGSVVGGERSMSSISSTGRPRKSTTNDSNPFSSEQSTTSTSSAVQQQPPAEVPVVSGVAAKEEKKGALSWIKGKLQERKEREEEKKRAKTPPRNGATDRSSSKQSLSASDASRGRSIDAPREQTAAPPQERAIEPVREEDLTPKAE
ncbi:hypothetical protein BJ546DRAFT_950438 [Cryomyces antarcticus]